MEVDTGVAVSLISHAVFTNLWSDADRPHLKPTTYGLSTYTVGDFGQMWQEHCEDADALLGYASAMRTLAEEHWSGNDENEDRIDWCRRTCLKYFLEGGLQLALAKDKRRQLARYHQSSDNTGSKALVEEVPLGLSRSNRAGVSSSPFHMVSPSCPVQEHLSGSGDVEKTTALLLSPSHKIRLLDVGSCFNPFLKYDEFLAIGIDIFPAVQNVYRCDFLSLELDAPLLLMPENKDDFVRQLPGPVIRSLPRDLFHAIVFSLLLSYFPSPQQRWLCCQKAYELLPLGGLLLIVTPDSSHATRHSTMMRSWRVAIEALGFKRWRYVKKSHIHLMAFRKVSCKSGSELIGDNYPEMLYIPQDFNWEDEEEESASMRALPRTDSENDLVVEAFAELPDVALSSTCDSDSGESETSSVHFQEVEDPVLLFA
uniref:S-adenosylmethionine sensor upstream of mTORC1 isoform X2 n=1 Tax=Myxine glutinosa TaxID=7769 RepID=UPI00358E24B6